MIAARTVPQAAPLVNSRRSSLIQASGLRTPTGRSPKLGGTTGAEAQAQALPAAPLKDADAGWPWLQGVWSGHSNAMACGSSHRSTAREYLSVRMPAGPGTWATAVIPGSQAPLVGPQPAAGAR